MSQSYVDFVVNLIYGDGLAPNPNHRDWQVANSPPTGTAWLEHHLDRMLAAYESWLISNNLPPVTPWDGVRRAPWDAGQDLPLGSDLDGSFTGVTSLEDLGQSLRNRYTQVASVASELAGLEKAPFSYRYWSYVKWAKDMRTRFQGQRVFPVTTVYDRDGTPLSATPFCDAFNDLHRNWHVGATASGVPTPGFRTTAGQRSRFGILGDPLRGEEFLRFHREHLEEIFHRWLDRTNQSHLRPVDMGRSGGWPPAPGSPQVNPPTPWAYNEAAVNPASDLAGQTTANQVGDIEFGYHGSGHGQNTDIGPLPHNNYVPRFHNWHRWIDSQWWWREPRFAQSDTVTGERTRIFRPVLQDGSDFPGLPSVSIVRDLSLPGDTQYPQNAVGGIAFATGVGTLRIKMYIRDPFDRTLRLRLKTEVLGSSGTIVPALTVTVHRNIGPSGDHPLDTEFTEDVAINGAFASDDPTRANPAVGFVHGRIRMTGTLWVPNSAAPDDPAQSPDPGFVHEDVTYVDLVSEKFAPEALIYQDLSSFSEDQVNSTMSGGTAHFNNAFYVVVQDRTSSSIPEPVWPPLVADEVKGLILGMRSASGLFDDIGHAPEVVLWQEGIDAHFNGVTLQLLGPPDKEDSTLPPEIPQRLTWRYAIVFNAINDAFTGLNQGDQRNARLRVTVRDRAGNISTVQTSVKFFKDANPYMIDGPTSWLSVDTRTFAIKEGETLLNETILADQPLQYLGAIIGRLNSGTTGVETFDTLPQEGLGAALEYSTEIPDPSTGTSKKIYNFALAKIRLRGSAGAQNVRAFFRLFRYSAPSLLFDANKGYRAFSNGGKVVPLIGFENQINGSPLTSIPFFATARRNTLTESMEAQEDLPNVHTFPPDPTDERVWYFGAWLDINDPNARLPSTYNLVSPNGPFSVASVQSLRTLMRDFHQCMVLEIRYDGDPTEPLASPASSDNLAQRNLSIMQSANPGNHWTRTVEQSFEIDLARPRSDRIAISTIGGHAHVDEGSNYGDELDHGETCPSCGHVGMDEDFCCECCGDVIDGDGSKKPLEENDPVTFASTFQFRRLLEEEVMSLTMRMENGGELMRQMMMGGHKGHHAVMRKVGPLAASIVRKAFPLVFHPTRWSQTANFTDELMIRWNNVPKTAKAYLFLPGVSAEQIVSLRNLRHAPKTVHSQGDSTLRLDVGGNTYIPISPTRGNRIAGLLRIILPEGVKAGQRYIVDVTQLRAGSTVQNGGFRIEILVRKEKEFASMVNRGVIHLKEQLSLTEKKNDIWHTILETRLVTECMRAKGLAEALGETWVDPTIWRDEDGNTNPIVGMKLRVILEKIIILDDSDPWLKGAGEVDFEVRVRTDNNGGIEQKVRLPKQGHYELSSGKSLEVNKTVFEGYADDHLVIRIDAMERDTFDPDDNLGSYARVFSCDAAKWFGRYGPEDEHIDPENLRYWKLYYRIERG